MSYTRGSREEAEFQKIFYADRQTLRNKSGIDNPDILERFERRATGTRAMSVLPKEAKQLTYSGFKAIHHHLFQDVYAWAGQERRYTTGRGPAPFAPPEQIAGWMEKRFAALKEENFLKGLSKDKFAQRAAEHVNEINAAHPFVDGNGRTQRTWLRLLADNNGFELRLSSNDRKAWNEASKTGFEKVNHKPMADLIKANLTTRSKSKSQQKSIIDRKAKQATKAMKQVHQVDKSHDRGR